MIRKVMMTFLSKDIFMIKKGKKGKIKKVQKVHLHLVLKMRKKQEI